MSPSSEPAVKKTKAPKTFADYQAKTIERRAASLESAVKLFEIAGKILSGGGTDHPQNIDESIHATQKRISSYLSSAEWLKSEWTPNGIRITIPPKEGYKGLYRVRIINQEPGFIAQIWHFEKTTDLQAKKPVPIVDYETGSYVTSDGAKEAAYEHAHDISIHHRIIRVWRVWYEGERDFAADQGGLIAMRQQALSCVTKLVMEGGKKATTDERIESLISDCQKPLLRYHSALDLFKSRWDASGTWIGPKKPKPNGNKKALKDPSHYLANFQKTIERKNWVESDSRILHALKQDFPVKILDQYEAIAFPEREHLANYEQLRTKVDLIPAEQS